MAFLATGRKCDLINLAMEIGESPQPNMRILELKEIITKNAAYEEEFIKSLLNEIISQRKEAEAEQRAAQREAEAEQRAAQRKAEAEQRTAQREAEQEEKERDHQLILEKMRIEADLAKSKMKLEIRKRELMKKLNAQTSERLNHSPVQIEMPKYVPENMKKVKSNQIINSLLEKRLCGPGKILVSINGVLAEAKISSGTAVTLIRKELVKDISLEDAPTMTIKDIFGVAKECPLVNIPMALSIENQTNVIHQEVLCAVAPMTSDEVIMHPEIINFLSSYQQDNGFENKNFCLDENENSLRKNKERVKSTKNTEEKCIIYSMEINESEKFLEDRCTVGKSLKDKFKDKFLLHEENEESSNQEIDSIPGITQPLREIREIKDIHNLNKKKKGQKVKKCMLRQKNEKKQELKAKKYKCSSRKEDLAKRKKKVKKFIKNKRDSNVKRPKLKKCMFLRNGKLNNQRPKVNMCRSRHVNKKKKKTHLNKCIKKRKKVRRRVCKEKYHPKKHKSRTVNKLKTHKDVSNGTDGIYWSKLEDINDFERNCLVKKRRKVEYKTWGNHRKKKKE